MNVETTCPHCSYDIIRMFELWELANKQPKVILCEHCDSYYVAVCGMQVSKEIYLIVEAD
jgi:hypothetical protein